MSRLLGTTFLLAIFVAIVSAEGPPSAFKMTAKRENDKVYVRVEAKKPVFSIHSPVGISQAVIERIADGWPDELVLRLHLQGLESLRILSGKVTLSAAVSAHDDAPQVRLWKDGNEDVLLDSSSPYAMEIRLVGGDGKPSKTIPLKGGYFEMSLPKELFKENPQSITISWIDFFRN